MIWQIAYPVLLYYTVSSIVYFVLQFFIVSANETYMLRQMICSLITIPVTVSFLRQDKAVEENVYGKADKSLNGEFFRDVIYVVVASIGFGIALNNVIAMTPLVTESAGFQNANTSFFAGGVWMEVLASGFVIPIAEELMFRGVVFKRLRMVLLDGKKAMILSAVIFGIFHFNIVQFIYAAVLGILLAYFVEKTRKVSLAVIGHMAANLAAILRAETGSLDFAYEPTMTGIGFTVMMASIGLMSVAYFQKAHAS